MELVVPGMRARLTEDGKICASKRPWQASCISLRLTDEPSHAVHTTFVMRSGYGSGATLVLAPTTRDTLEAREGLRLSPDDDDL